MWKLTNIALALLLTATTHAQLREVADSGIFVFDRVGRVVRLEGRDGIVVDYFYDGQDATETSGLAVRVNAKLTLTVSHAPGEVVVPGLPKLTSVFDAEGRTTAVLADGTAVARLSYTGHGLFSNITVPGHFTWKASAPDLSHRVRQAVENASGQVVTKAVVTTGADVDGIRRGAAYELAVEDVDGVVYEQSPTGALTTARDAHGRVAFYVVHTDTCDVGFSPDGKARFYDLKLSVLGGAIAPGSDVVISKAWEGQRGTVPDRLILTARGAVGVYAEESAHGAIDSVWVDSAGKLHTTQ